MKSNRPKSSVASKYGRRSAGDDERRHHNQFYGDWTHHDVVGIADLSATAIEILQVSQKMASIHFASRMFEVLSEAGLTVVHLVLWP